ncbi:hypothetical protein DCO58_07315 [Helicobacter saguini]|uniref:Valyl-tRNA synthetase n=1 Tax=Helicobacter saguini TaxID=1548018 RepID=A0A347VN91_9HELI|nr:DUF5718 family protein [Helicobacter saguini]MWV61858.1 hypothetical protein [Helicobacter saguini]MWV67467.1 hypothetical protein [Helicobacter saguini]MWV69818.1 hypothetical protein [Helicobacter saguini]MWV72964.1 hypothetical protein [Helicobacter saguini]TLD95656.1 hypothetical protein LS64_002035 [Helicobacter saguini]
MKDIMGFGVAGNFANHLEQAGESGDFADVASDEEGAPKGIFPFYIPQNSDYLGRFCIDRQRIMLPQDKSLHVQAEPEIALLCNVEYENGLVKTLQPTHFMAFDDTSVRNDSNASKISQKKNFSHASKGYGKQIELDKFEKGGICDDFSLTSFLLFDGEIHQYGDNAKLVNYSFFYQKLMKWIIKKFNTQEDFAVLENLRELIAKAGFPRQFLIAIGATSYTHFAETRFLRPGDEVCIVAYNHKIYDNKKIKELISAGVTGLKHASIVRQMVE